MNKYTNYKEAEDFLIRKIILQPDFITNTTYEIIGTGFILKDPLNNQNNRSDYAYAYEFFTWMMTGDKKLSNKLLTLNPWVERFTDIKGLPDSFSSTYGWKIKDQLSKILTEIHNHKESRRSYVNILYPEDKAILDIKTTHEYPCTIGFQIFVRDDKVHMIVNMRSNNVYSVMPYDIYNFTMLQNHIAKTLKLELGWYYHMINNAHMYKGDIRRVKESLFLKS